MRLSELLEDVPVKSVRGKTEIEISGITNHSKNVEEGALFVAICGTKEDGRAYVREAVQNGAVAVVSESPIGVDAVEVVVENARQAQALIARAFFGYPNSRLRIVGITGTNGKTSSAILLHSIVKASGHSSGLIGTVYYELVDKRMRAGLTTPDSIELYGLLAKIVERGGEYCVMEVSSHSLDLDRVEGIDFSVGVFTGFSPREHTDYHGSDRAYLEAKLRLFERLSPEAGAVLNWDNEWVREAEGRTCAEKMRFGTSEECEVRICEMRCTFEGTELELETPGGWLSIRSKLLGEFAGWNLACACASALSLGFSLESIKSGAEAVERIAGRMEKIESDAPFLCIVDYAHNEEALKNLLRTVRTMGAERIIVTFGAGGDRDPRKRTPMGKIACKLADYTILTADNSRSESTEKIIAQIARGFTSREKYETEPDRRKAIARALSLATPGTCVVIAGKGHEDYQLIRDKRFDFNDREVAREVLSELGYKVRR